MKRNLLYHAYPIRGSVWDWHSRQLVRYRDVWNGRRIVSIVTDTLTEPEARIRERLAPLEAELFFRPNQAYFAEVKYFVETLGLLESRDPDEATFYAHAKGVSYHREPEEKREKIQRWSRAMYELCLYRPDLVDRLLSRYSALGCFRLSLNRSSRWIYSGTFWWIRHDTLFSRDWRDIIPEKHGVEDYPGRHIKREESFCLTPDEIPWRALYDGYVTEDRIRAWKAALEEELPCTLP